MGKPTGFDNERYLSEQTQAILDRVSKFKGKLYLEFGGKLSYDWHAGWSFSTRYLTGLFPVYTIGLCFFLDKYGRKAVVLAVIGTCYSVFLFFNWYLCVIHGQWETPIDMVCTWIAGKRAFCDYWNEVTPGIFLKRIWNACRYKFIVRGLI